MSEPSVLVTGAAGFIGSHIVEALLTRGHRVVGVDNFDPFYARALKERALRTSRRNPEFQFMELDLRNLGALARAVEGTDAVVHLAARPGVRQSVEQPALYRELNETATGYLLQACEAAGIRRVVFASSSSVYGRVPLPFQEDLPAGVPLSPYAAGKLAAEGLVRGFAQRRLGSGAIVRLFSVYGPRQRPDLVMHRFARLLLAGSPLPLFGDGSSQRDYTHVADVTEGVLRALAWTEAAPGDCEVFNLGSGVPTRLDWVVSELARALGTGPCLEPQPAHPADLPATWADTAKARAMLGFEPRIPLADGIRDFVAWFEGEHGRQPCPAA